MTAATRIDQSVSEFLQRARNEKAAEKTRLDASIAQVQASLVSKQAELTQLQTAGAEIDAELVELDLRIATQL